MPATVVLSAIYGSTFMAAAALGAVGYAVAGFAINLVATMVISSIIAKRADPGGGGQGQKQIGNRVQLPPATDNKIGVVYGSAYMKPILVDAKISTDQKTMWHVLVYSEAMNSDSVGTFSYGDIYWGDKKLNFDGTDQTKVVSWTNSDGTTETTPDGLLNVYLYRDGSFTPTNTALTAVQVLQDEAISEANRWDSTKRMTKLVFAIVKIKYDQEKGITGLAEITAEVSNTLVKPGAVIKDYLTNTRYGAGLPLDKVDTVAMAALDTYSDDTISFTPAGGGAAQTMSRYRINGPVDTTKNFLDNLVDLCESCDSWLQWNEVTNKWSVIINRSYLDLDADSSELRQVDSSSIIGGINLNPIDLNSTFNEVEVQFPNTKTKDQPGYHFIDLTEFPNVRRSPNEPDNKLTIALPYCNNIVQAQYIAARRLLQSREDLVINFTMDYSGIQIDAGDVIGIHHEQYGWGRYSTTASMPYGKLFRVHQVQESKSDDGFLFAQIAASEYNDDVYDDDSIDLQDFTPAPNTGIPDPTIINTPGTPTITNVEESAVIPEFTVNTVAAATGTAIAMEFWYSTVESLESNVYTLYRTEYPNSGNSFAQGETISTIITGLPAGTYYWRTRAVGLRRKSNFTLAASIVWAPEIISSVTGQNFQVFFQPPYISIPRTGTNLTPQLASVRPRAFGQEGASIIAFTTATSDADPAFTNSSWRIASNSLTNYTNSIIQDGISFNVNQITVNNNGLLFGTATSITSSPASITVPCRYKDAAGNVFQSSPSVAQFSFIDPGAQGQAGFNGLTVTYPKVWFLAPINATTATVTNGVYNRGTQLWETRPITRYTTAGNPSTPITVDNYDYAVSVTTGTYRYNALADANVSSVSTGTFTAVWSITPQIEAGFGPTPQFIDFTYSGGTAFYKDSEGVIAPSSITLSVIQNGISNPAGLWTVTGGTFVTTTTNFALDTITITPINASTVTSVTVNVSVGGLTKAVVFPIVGQGVPGEPGEPGAASERGFVPLAYIPITLNPNTATQEQLTAAWTAYTGLSPIFNDGGSFYFGTISKSFSYNASGVWVAATLKIAGDLIADGTIRANSIAANEIFTNKLASTSATGTNFGSNSSPGYWLDGASGNAHFGGNVHIGNNLTVEGLIASSELSANVVYTNNVVINAITNGQVVFVEKSRSVTLSATSTTNADSTIAWPANTRGLAIPGGSAIVPEVGPEDGGRIIIQLSSTVYQATNPDNNLIELWRAGSTVNFAQEVRAVAVPFNLTTGTTLAVGTESFNRYSTNESTWSSGDPDQPVDLVPNGVDMDQSFNNYAMAVGNDGTAWWYDMSGSVPNYVIRYNLNKLPVRVYPNTPTVRFADENLNKIRVKRKVASDSFTDTFIVGSRGFVGFLDTIGTSGVWQEDTGTLADLYDIAFSTGYTSSAAYRAIAVGDAGTIIKCDRSLGNAFTTPQDPTWSIQADVPVFTNLRGIACNLSNTWIAVGHYGVILRSTDNGDNWSLVDSGVTNNLTSVSFGNSRWTAVGLGGVILTSTNGTTWTNVSINDRNLYEVRYEDVSDNWVAVGDAQILSSSNGTTYTQGYDGGRTQSFSYKRLWYVGSNDDPLATTTAPVSNRLGQRASVSMIINDTDYVVSDDPSSPNVYIYYLVVGNLSGNGPITVTNPFLLTTEFKR